MLYCGKFEALASALHVDSSHQPTEAGTDTFSLELSPLVNRYLNTFMSAILSCELVTFNCVRQ